MPYPHSFIMLVFTLALPVWSVQLVHAYLPDLLTQGFLFLLQRLWYFEVAVIMTSLKMLSNTHTCICSTTALLVQWHKVQIQYKKALLSLSQTYPKSNFSIHSVKVCLAKMSVEDCEILIKVKLVFTGCFCRNLNEHEHLHT